MPKYNLSIQECEEFGYNGIVVGEGRVDFQPGLGRQIAHDLIEHPTAQHEDPFVDELMALGGVLAGRVDCEFVPYDATRYYTSITFDDISSDVSSLITYSPTDTFPANSSNFKLRDKNIMEKIKVVVLAGIKSAEYEMDEMPEIDVDSIISWIAKGYSLFIKRFGVYNYTISCDLFNEIARQCDKFLNTGSIGDIAIMRVCYSQATCFIDYE